MSNQPHDKWVRRSASQCTSHNRALNISVGRLPLKGDSNMLLLTRSSKGLFRSCYMILVKHAEKCDNNRNTYVILYMKQRKPHSHEGIQCSQTVIRLQITKGCAFSMQLFKPLYSNTKNLACYVELLASINGVTRKLKILRSFYPSPCHIFKICILCFPTPPPLIFKISVCSNRID